MLGLNRGASVHVVQFTSALSSLRTLQVNEKDSISLGASESELVRYVEWRLGDWLILVPSFWYVGVGVPVVGCWLWGHKWGLVFCRRIADQLLHFTIHQTSPGVKKATT